jgi:hypothetical protein
VPAKLEPPKSLAHLAYFVLRFERNTKRFELIEPQKTNSYDIGGDMAAQAYFDSIGMEYLGGRAMNAARNFGASQALIKENRAFGLDLCQINLDAGIIQKQHEIDLFFACNEEDEIEPVF